MSGEPDHAPAVTVAGSWLRLLKSGGVDYLFANAGTDFAPLIEAYASAVDRARTLPDPVTVPHENVAIHMAIGYWLVTRRMQAVIAGMLGNSDAQRRYASGPQAMRC
ncbi:MAG TPA: thiamine pyrophosphate-binding protein [Burkholderiaceae bacterium]|nr:thiamine pyrophosphate-binding protein [Burkholderiaceae bacterium]